MSIWHNPIADMFGPLFLIVYLVVIIGVILFCKMKLNMVDDTLSQNKPFPIPTSPDPYKIAYLRGGVNEVMRLAVFKLLKIGALKVEPLEGRKDKSTAQQIKSDQTVSTGQSLNEIESAINRYYQIARKSSDMFSDINLTSSIEQFCSSYKAEFVTGDLIAPKEWGQEREKVVVPGLIIILSFGGYKLLAALNNGHENVGFLVIEAIVGSIVLFSVCKLPAITQRGKRYLSDLKHSYGAVSAQSYNQSNDAMALELGLASVAILGMASPVAASDETYKQLFNKAATTSSSSGGGCGSSSSCGGGGGGCGSGGCGGGGCGGCGGGGD
jgi:uncharacterized protein (TIGR04222 family)